MSKWVTIGARIPEEKYKEYKDYLEMVKEGVTVRNDKGEFTMSMFITLCIDKFMSAYKRSRGL